MVYSANLRSSQRHDSIVAPFSPRLTDLRDPPVDHRLEHGRLGIEVDHPFDEGDGGAAGEGLGAPSVASETPRSPPDIVASTATRTVDALVAGNPRSAP